MSDSQHSESHAHLRRASDSQAMTEMAEAIGRHSMQLTHADSELKAVREELQEQRTEFRSGFRDIAASIRDGQKSSSWTRGEFAAIVVMVVAIVTIAASVVGIFVSGKTDGIAQKNDAQDRQQEALEARLEAKNDQIVRLQQDNAVNSAILSERELRRNDAMKFRDAQFAGAAEFSSYQTEAARKQGEKDSIIIDLRSQIRHLNGEPQVINLGQNHP